MSVTYGFYNSKNGDRRYDAIQMSAIFDGIIRDGVFQHIGTAMMVEESEGMAVNVGIGRAWFNHTWTLNDAPLPLAVPLAEVILNRIDAVVLEVDARESARANSIKIVKGVPASNPQNPTLIKTNDYWQYPLAYIRVDAGVTAIRQADITNCVGTSACPFITAPLEMMSIDALVAQWEDQWDAFFSQMQQNTASNWQQAEAAFTTWFQHMKDQLSDDAAGNLQTQLDTLRTQKASTEDVEAAEATANNAREMAEAAQVTADAAMPKTGGTFTGDVAAISTNRNTTCLRNSEVRVTSVTGTVQSTNKLIFVRK